MWENTTTVCFPRGAVAFPSKSMHDYKFWPHVGRVDNVFGDRNLVAPAWGWRIILNAIMKTGMLLCCLIVVCTTATVIAADATNSVAESKAQKIQRLMQITGARQTARQSAGQIIGQRGGPYLLDHEAQKIR